ncbi:MAG: mechanosensitive ion channel [Deltaproteobacteria bacterium]
MEKITDLLALVKSSVWLQRLLIVIAYAILAKLVDLFVNRVLARLTARTKMTLDDRIIAFLHTPVIWTVFTIGILHALSIPPPLEPPWNTALPNLAKTLIIVLWGFAFLRLFNQVADLSFAEAISRGKIGQDLYNLIYNLAKVVLVAAAVLWILAVWQVNLTPMFASAGIAGIAIALAAKDTLANFFGGISIFVDRTYKVGDYIIIDSNDRGEVVDIGIRSTRIKTRDDVLITIPNSLLANAKIINESAPEPRFRIRVPVGVAYESDLDQVEDVLLRVALTNPAVVRDPAPRVRVRAFADSSVNFELLCWLEDPSFKGREIHNILKAIFKTFKQEGISIPFPQRDVHLQQNGEKSA